MGADGIGAAVRRKEDFRFLTGRGVFTDDINRPGQLYAYILRSSQPHAKIKRIDVCAATMRGHGMISLPHPPCRLDDPGNAVEYARGNQ